MILLVEDDSKLAKLLLEEVQDLGQDAEWAKNVSEAKQFLRARTCELIVSDLQLPDGTGMDILEFSKKRKTKNGFILITAFGTVNQAVEALKAGADDFLTKPLNFDHFAVSINRVLEHYVLKNRLADLERNLGEESFHGMISKSKSMENLIQETRQISRTDGPVLIIGESGVGKELVAKALHEESERSSGNFVAVNCASFPENLIESEFFGHQEGSFTGANKSKKGLFREASGGTLFLDEIGEMPLSLQAKLLRVLQDKKVRPVGGEKEVSTDVRLIAATNRDLEYEIQEGRFREDLYYRLETFALFVPPLRDRKEDLNVLIPFFCDNFSKRSKKKINEIDPEFMEALKKYSFPGNIRELRNIIERAVVFSKEGRLKKENLPRRILKSVETPLAADLDDDGTSFKVDFADAGAPPVLAEVENAYIDFILKMAGGNKKRAASLLGIGRRTLYRRVDAKDE